MLIFLITVKFLTPTHIMQVVHDVGAIDEELMIAEPDVPTHRAVPTLEQLALNALAVAVHQEEPLAVELPFGGGAAIIQRLAASGRLRPETLQPLLTDWSSSETLGRERGDRLVGAAGNCRGLSALAAQRLSFQHRQQQQREQQLREHRAYRRLDQGIAHPQLPSGTRKSDSENSRSCAAGPYAADR